MDAKNREDNLVFVSIFSCMGCLPSEKLGNEFDLISGGGWGGWMVASVFFISSNRVTNFPKFQEHMPNNLCQLILC